MFNIEQNFLLHAPVRPFKIGSLPIVIEEVHRYAIAFRLRISRGDLNRTQRDERETYGRRKDIFLVELSNQLSQSAWLIDQVTTGVEITFDVG